jgi:hypothetical protein
MENKWAIQPTREGAPICYPRSAHHTSELSSTQEIMRYIDIMAELYPVSTSDREMDRCFPQQGRNKGKVRRIFISRLGWKN